MLSTRTSIVDILSHVGETVTLMGWIHIRRDMGKLAFLDMRDRSGIAQIVLVPGELDEASKAVMSELRSEYCIQIEGIVQKRGEKQINPNLPTGTVEVLAKRVVVLNAAKALPFELEHTLGINEELRLKYRYLDLRSERMQKNLILRDKVMTFFRAHMHELGFLEIETPILTKGTPEGSREYLVPSRLHDGQFYVLPQSPQQFKQLCMVAGLEKYFQIARCFRDEDQRGDRQPEFTQVDMELSFVEQEDMLQLVEKMMIELVKTVSPEKKIQQVPFPRLTYAESMEKYGNDKPDLREDKNDPNSLAFCWVVDFPMFEADGEGGLQAVHHPFTSPKAGDEGLLETDPLKARANAYDVVLNGYEIGGGSIRIHKRDLQNRVFQLLGLSQDLIDARFGHMLEAFEFGAPPHGGLALGVDRIPMILAGEPNIREVIAFPKTGDARDPLMGAPSEIEESRLMEAHIQIRKKA